MLAARATIPRLHRDVVQQTDHDPERALLVAVLVQAISDTRARDEKVP